MGVAIETTVVETPSAKGSFGFRFMAPLCLGSMLNPVNSTMISTALVAIARDFQATVAETGLLIGGLYITSAIAQPTMGRLADRLGARRVFLVGLYLVALAGVAGTFAPSLRALIWVRVLLGIGTSAAYPTAMRILRNRAAQTGSVEPRMALGILSMSALSTVAVGAALGGILTGLGGWRMVFTVNLPLAVLGILLVFLWIPEDQTKPAGLRKLAKEVDVLGIVLFAGLLLTGMFFLMSLGHPNWLMLAVSVLIGFVLMRHFTAHETTVPQHSDAREQHSPERNVSALRCDEFDDVLHAVRLFAMAADGPGVQQHESRPHHTAHVRPCCSLRSRWRTDEKHT